MLYDVIRNDLKTAMKNKEMDIVNALRVIIGEFPRLNKKAGELPTDDEVIKILKSLKKNEEIVLEKKGWASSTYLLILERYLPTMMSKDEIKHYIDTSGVILDNTNIGPLMGRLMKDLKGKAEGSLVKEVLSEVM